MLKKFITRPVMATVVSLVLVLLGLVAITQLPITRFPVIAPPSISVSASYPGADAETVAQSVLLPLETSINGVRGMTYLKSQASTGGGTVTVYFKQGTDPHQAAVQVQNRVSGALSDLPAPTVTSGVSVTPKQSGIVMTINMYSVDPAINATFLNVYANREVARELIRIDGLAGASIIGYRNYAIRIWMNPNKMKAYGLEPDDIKEAVKSQNFSIAPGEFGQNSNQTFQRIIAYGGRFTSTKEFKQIVVKTNEDGSILHLGDVVRIELGPTNAHNVSRVDGYPGITMNITQNVGSNARQIDIAVRKKMKELAKQFPKGVKYDISYSIRNQIDQSIEQVVHTLFEAFILVFIVVFIFLQDLRTTIIPAIAIPVSLIGTFFFIYLLGFSVNVLTMFALVLSIGIVVDDAIVVVEAVHQKMESTSLSPKNATIETMKEITPAIISITMVMAAVFIPVGFMSGPSGVFYRQFAYTLAVAILISAMNALTLSPALCAIILRKDEGHVLEPSTAPTGKRFSKENIKAQIQRFFTKFNTTFKMLTRKYIKSIKYLAHNKKLSMAGLVLVILLGVILMQFTSTGFIPQEDDGFISYSLKLPPSSSLARTTNVLDEALGILKDRKEIRTMSSSAGFNVIDGTNSTSYAAGYITMYPYSQRKGITNINQLVDTLRHDMSKIKGASVSLFQRPTVTGFGKQSGLHFVLEDKLGGNFQAFGAVADTFLTALKERPEILSASTTFQPDVPKYEIDIKQDKAVAMGVDVKNMMQNIRMYYSRVRISEFNLFNRQNNVYIQSAPQYSATPKSLKSIYVRNDGGQMVPVSTLVTLHKTVGPEIVTRYNLYNSIEVNATPARGYSTGQAMNVVKEVASEILPRNYTYEWTGMSRAESQSGAQTIFIILLSFLFVYLLLSAKYESYIIPFSILLSVPVGLIGVYIAVNLAGLQNNIYVQVGLIMLIGLLAKNAILIVEYSQQQRQAGLSIFESAIKGARLRLRPILMTSFAFVAGLIPLMWAQGPSAQGNHSISFGAAGGMISGVLFGIFIVPVLYIIFRQLDEKLTARPNKGD